MPQQSLTPHPEHHHVILPSVELRDTCGTAPLTDPLAAFSQSVGQATARLVTAQMFGRFRDPVTTGMERPAEVSDDVEKAIWERIQQRRLAQAQPQRGWEVAPTTSHGSVFQRLGGRPGSPAGEEKFQVQPEMTPRKIERGRQPGRGSDVSEKPASRSQLGHKRRSASQGRDQVDSKKEKKDGGSVGATAGKDRKVAVGIDWSTAAIERPARKTSQHPFFKPDHSGTSKSRRNQRLNLR